MESKRAARPHSETISLPGIRHQMATLQSAERFFDSVVLFTLFDLGVFQALEAGPRSLEELSDSVGGNAETLRAVLDAAVALGVLGKEGERYGADESLLACLGRPDSPEYLGEWVAFLHALATPLLQLGDAVRTGEPPGALFEDMSGDNLPARRMTQAMDAYARTRGVEMAGRMDFSDVETLLDLGCGPGTYSLAVVDRFPHVRATLLDLAGPIAEARRIVGDRGMADRVEFVVADALAWEPEERFDAVLVSNTLHMLGPALSARLLKRCYDMVQPGGRLIVQAQYLRDDRTSPRWPTLLNLIQRVATPHGRNHALGETTAWMEAAGFEDVRHEAFSAWNVNSVLVGSRPR